MKKLALILTLASGCSININSLKQDCVTYIKDANNDGHVDTRVTIYGKPRKTVTETDTNYDGKMDLMVSAEVLKGEGKLILEELVQIDADYETGIDYEVLLRYDKRQILADYEFSAYEGKEKRRATEEEVAKILDLIDRVNN